MSVQRGFFELDERYAALSAVGDPLEKLGRLIDFELFRPDLDTALQRSDGSKGRRPPLDAVMMFKVLVLQALYRLSDAQAGFQILDRRSFGRFLGFDDGDNTPDETTIWRFREALVRADASITGAPRQHMTDEERAIIKGGSIPETWAAKPARLAQKDRDARWTLKRGRRKKGADGKPMAEIATPTFGHASSAPSASSAPRPGSASPT